jgi:hypothetical protein
LVDARGDLAERRFQLAFSGGGVDITEQDETEQEPEARVTGPVSAWVRALGPEGSSNELQITGQRALAEAALARDRPPRRRRLTRARR